MVTKPRNSKNKRVVSEFGDKGREGFLVRSDREGEMCQMSDVSRGDRSSIYNLEGARDTEGVQGEVMLADKVFIYEGESRGSTIYQCM